MGIFKKKGSIVPRYLLTAIEKKSQHQIKFGCDVEIVGNTVYMVSDGCCIYFPSRKYCNLKKNKGNNKRRVKGFKTNKNMTIDGSRVAKSATLRIELKSTPIINLGEYK